MVHLLAQWVARLVKSGHLSDGPGVRRAASLLVLAVVGCTFDSASDPPPAFEAGDTGSSVTGSLGDTTGGPELGTSSTSTSAGPSDTASDAASTGGVTEGETSTSVASGEEEGTTGEVASSTSEGPVDCTTPITLTQTAAEGTLSGPMQLGMFEGSEYAFSLEQNAGAIRFTFEVACPSTYRLFGRVRDDVPGTGPGDPDSFDVEGPDGLFDSWFYGCDTLNPGWTWAQVEAGKGLGSCNEPLGLMVPLSADSHDFVFRNREAAVGQAHAGIAELVLTNDPSYAP